MIVKPLIEHHLEFLSLKGGCTGSYESPHVKMPHCWKSHALAQFYHFCVFQYPILKAACVNKKSWTVAILHMHRQKADLFMKEIIMRANIKLLGLLVCFHYILNPPRTRPFVFGECSNILSTTVLVLMNPEQTAPLGAG